MLDPYLVFSRSAKDMGEFIKIFMALSVVDLDGVQVEYILRCCSVCSVHDSFCIQIS